MTQDINIPAVASDITPISPDISEVLDQTHIGASELMAFESSETNPLKVWIYEVRGLVRWLLRLRSDNDNAKSAADLVIRINRYRALKAVRAEDDESANAA